MKQFAFLLNNPALLKSLGTSLLLGFLTSYFLIPPIIVVARRLGAVDRPDGKRKIHTNPTPRLGGIAIYAGILTGILSGIVMLIAAKQSIYVEMSSLLGIFVGASFIVLLGVADDFFSLRPLEKYLGQIASAFIAIIFGYSISFINLPYFGMVSLGFWSIPITLFWITAMINIINFIDGLDGLAAGVSAIAGASFLIHLVIKGNFTLSLIVASLIGASLGFLRYNFYPARIFMGDSGSMLLGYLFGVISINGVLKSVSALSLLVPIVVMGVPIVDTFLAIVRRASAGRPITEADSKHIHHRLMHKGLGHKGAVIVIYIWSAFLAFSGVALSFTSSSFLKVVYTLIALIFTIAIVSFTGILEEIRIVLNERKR